MQSHPLTVEDISESMTEALKAVGHLALQFNPACAVTSYSEIKNALCLTNLSDEQWDSAIIKGGLFTTMKEGLKMDRLTCVQFRKVITQCFQTLQLQPNRQVFHHIITQLFDFLKDFDGFVHVCVHDRIND